MTVQALGYIQNNGDGSTSIQWIQGEDQEEWEEYVAKKAFDSFHDGDGITLRETLVFASYLDAEACGISFYTKTEWYSCE